MALTSWTEYHEKVTKTDEGNLECILLLLPGKSNTIRVIHSCFAADKKFWGIHGTHIASPIVEIPGRKACKKLFSMESYLSREGFLTCKTVEELLQYTSRR
jgi:hypothetical protein